MGESKIRRAAAAAIQEPTPGPWEWCADTMENHAQESLGHSGADGFHEVLLAVSVRDADRRLIAAAPEMAALLGKLQFSDDDLKCPECGGFRPSEAKAIGRHPGHHEGCYLAELLSRVDPTITG